MVESVGVLSCIWAHEDASAKEVTWKPCGWCSLLWVPLDVFQSASMVNGYPLALFQVSEELSKFRWAGVEWEAFCPEDCAAGERVCHVICSRNAWLGLRDCAVVW